MPGGNRPAGVGYWAISGCATGTCLPLNSAPMRFGVTLPNTGYGGDPATLIELAVDAEEAGWDGVFFWDTPYAAAPDEPVMAFADAWVLLSGVALSTERVRLGTMLT
ncbi:MAG: LLM class flavin-dependent oxidoreductase, partial [Dehalococcoidia bacterium]|nr:LLM class flavin-dependent oxidoreductase [Dehalococcoidia bacterium]